MELLKKIQMMAPVQLDCPCCRSSVNTIAYQYENDAGKSDILFCETCSFMFARPLPIADLEDRHMDSITDAELHTPLFKTLHKSLVLNREIRSVRNIFGKGEPSLLDIGCGIGWTTAYWKEKGFAVTGVEPSEVRAKIARDKYDIPIINDYFEHAVLEERYDVIIFRHIIEHFENPYELLNKATQSLKEGGVLLLVVPNINCLGRYLFEENWLWILPWHCNFFTPKAITSMVKRLQLDMRALYQTPSPLYYSESLARKFPASAVARCIAANGFPSFIFSSCLSLAGLIGNCGDNITAIVQKNTKGPV